MDNKKQIAQLWQRDHASSAISSESFSFVTMHACVRQTDRITTPKTALAHAGAVITNDV